MINQYEIFSSDFSNDTHLTESIQCGNLFQLLLMCVCVCVFFAYVFFSEIQLENVDMPAYDFLFLSNL